MRKYKHGKLISEKPLFDESLYEYTLEEHNFEEDKPIASYSKIKDDERLKGKLNLDLKVLQDSQNNSYM